MPIRHPIAARAFLGKPPELEAPGPVFPGDGADALRQDRSGAFLRPTAMNPAPKYLIAALLAVLSASAGAGGWTLGPDLRDHRWVDSDGGELRLSRLRSPLIVMTMAYTTCRRVCSTTTLVLSDIQKRLEAMKIDADFVVVGLDPENDSPADWRDYRSQHKLNRENWHFLSGDAQSTRKLARGLDLSFWTYHDHIVHDFRIVLFDAQWQQVGEVNWADTDRLESILAKLPFAIRMPRPLS